MFLIKKLQTKFTSEKKIHWYQIKKIHLYQIKNSLIPLAALVGSSVF